MYYGGPTAMTQYSWCIVIVGVLWEKRTYRMSLYCGKLVSINYQLKHIKVHAYKPVLTVNVLKISQD